MLFYRKAFKGNYPKAFWRSQRCISDHCTRVWSSSFCLFLIFRVKVSVRSCAQSHMNGLEVLHQCDKIGYFAMWIANQIKRFALQGFLLYYNVILNIGSISIFRKRLYRRLRRSCNANRKRKFNLIIANRIAQFKMCWWQEVRHAFAAWGTRLSRARSCSRL